MNDNEYFVVIREPFAACPAGTASNLCRINKGSLVQSCSVVRKDGSQHPKSSDWCLGADPNQQRDKQLTFNYLSYPSPVDLMP